MTGPNADRDLLFGLLALQNGLIDQDQLVAAFQAWTRDKARPLADHLVARGDLDAEQRAGVEALVALHLKKHGGDAEQSLAAIPAGPSTRESLAALGDPEIEHDPRPSSAPARRRRRRPHRQLRRRHRHRRRPAVPRPAAPRPRRPGRRLRGARRRAAPRGGAQADPRPARRRPGQPRPVPARGRDHRRAGAPGDRPGLRPGHLRRRPAVLRHAVHPRRQPQGGHRPLPRRRVARRTTPAGGRWSCASCCGGSSTSATRSTTPTAAACCTATSSRATSSSASTARPWWSTGAWPRRWAGPSPASDSGERTLVPSSASGSAETLPGSGLGTPAYMSPEQAAGDLERLGPRSDVYSLGATLYCLLTGRPPFEGDVGEVLRAVQRGEFPPPRQLDPTIDPALEAVCLKAMAHRPEDRYAVAAGAGRGHRAVDGRRAGLGLARAARRAAPAAGRGGTGRR